MKKSDLTPYTYVVLRNGKIGLILNDMYICGIDWWISLADYNNDLENTINTENTIIEIYKLHGKIGITLERLLTKEALNNYGNLVFIRTTDNQKLDLRKYSDTILFHRLDEIDGEFQDFHISAHKSDILSKEKDTIKQELTQRGYSL